MSDDHPLRGPNFPSAREDLHDESNRPSSFKLAYTDQDFLLRDELRGLRFQLELQKPEITLQEQGIESTVVIFGSARSSSPEQAERQVREAETSGDPAQLRRAKREQRNSYYYQQSQELASLITEHTLNCPSEEQLYVMTGGGPGIMEAANRGAYESEGKSIGLNIVLPREQEPNPYISPEFCFRFHYFGIRKMHFMLRAKALVVFPGGFGTMDELYEALTLIQTGKSRKVPIILVGHDFWRKAINLEFLRDEGLISAADVELVHTVNSAQQAWQYIADYYHLSSRACPRC